MLRSLALSTLVTFAIASASHAGNVQVNFSGGSGAPLTVILPQAVTFTVANDTPSNNANFVFLGVGNVTGSSVRGAAGTLNYTANGGSALSINSVGNFNLGVVTTNDLSVFKSASPGVNLNDVLLLSSGSVTTTTNITAAAPPSGLYSAIFVDVNGVQLGVGTAILGDFNNNGTVDAADYVVWRKNPGGIYTANDYNIWRAHFGQPGGSGSVASANAAVPEPTTLAMLIVAAVGIRLRRR